MTHLFGTATFPRRRNEPTKHRPYMWPSVRANDDRAKIKDASAPPEGTMSERDTFARRATSGPS
ncbi:hypothetical protein PISMIDRAFT_680622 [Pisolithus microcarpus 441]|uniref:Uncharacterized protein n=1 Tax=Pisolithus microcarpus 441 TaxID=765257 RepID=A0A0C9ZHX6_9AGAM|nr:hypothetical protein PISMIDRAFT_680622 [Pisolithus microcarpus 441]